MHDSRACLNPLVWRPCSVPQRPGSSSAPGPRHRGDQPAWRRPWGSDRPGAAAGPGAGWARLRDGQSCWRCRGDGISGVQVRSQLSRVTRVIADWHCCCARYEPRQAGTAFLLCCRDALVPPFQPGGPSGGIAYTISAASQHNIIAVFSRAMRPGAASGWPQLVRLLRHVPPITMFSHVMLPGTALGASVTNGRLRSPVPFEV